MNRLLSGFLFFGSLGVLCWLVLLVFMIPSGFVEPKVKVGECYRQQLNTEEWEPKSVHYYKVLRIGNEKVLAHWISIRMGDLGEDSIYLSSFRYFEKIDCNFFEMYKDEAKE